MAESLAVPADRPGSAAGDGLPFKSSPGRWVLAVAVLGSGMAFLDGTVVNVALPDIGHDLNASTAALQWILNGYLLTLASLILLGGSLGDRYGRRRIFMLGAGLFTAASLLCALAPNAELLVVARLLQGIGGALLTPGSLAMIEASFRPADRARAIGAWSGLGGVAAALGPLLGGYLVGAVSWRAIFLINLPLGVFVIAMASRHVPETRDPTTSGHLDFTGATLAALGLAGILGLELGDPHVIRNAGGVIADDEIRSLPISQHLLGTEEIMLIHHTDCGMLTFSDQEFADKLERETGQRPQWEARSFPDLDQDGGAAELKAPVF